MTTPTPEDKLSALLREEAESIRPVGDGLARIQKRVATRRRTRWVLPGALVATAAAASFVFVLTDSDRQSALQQKEPGTTTGPSCGPTALCPSQTAEPTATPTTSGGGLDHPLENPAIWPFTSSQEIADWKSTYPYAGDKTALVQRYLKDVLSLDGAFTLTKPCESCDVVDIRLGSTKVGQAALERFELDGERVYTISTIGETDLKLTTPTDGEAITSPTRVTGRLTGVDENVRITLTDSAGGQLGTTTAPAGSDAPWQGSVSWSATGWVHGAVVLTTYSAKDGSLTRLTVVPVTRGDGGTTTGPTFVGIRGGRVDLFDGTTGAFVKHLTYPKAPDVDLAAVASGSSVLWVREKPSGCASSLLRLDGGAAHTVVPMGAYRISNPHMSADGRTIGYNREPCSGAEDPAMVVDGPAGRRVLDFPKDEPQYLEDVSDDGAVLYGVGVGDGGTVLLPPGATWGGSGNGSVVLREQKYPDCGISTGRFDGNQAIAFETCTEQGGKHRLVVFRLDGTRVATGAWLDLLIITSASVDADGVVLLSGSDVDDAPTQVFTTTGDALTLVRTPTGTGQVDWPSGA